MRFSLLFALLSKIAVINLVVSCLKGPLVSIFFCINDSEKRFLDRFP